MGVGAESQGPVFVVGMNGSGTTMLADCLGHHPDLYMFPFETRVLPHFILGLSSYGDLTQLPARRRLAEALGKCRAYWDVNGRKRVRLDDEMLRDPCFSGVVNGLYGYFASQEGKSRWGEKTPMYLQHMALLAKHIPDARFVHVYRDGRDAAQSFHRRFGQDPRRTIYRWRRIVKTGREQGGQLGPSRYMEVSYEALTSEPELHMSGICAFLDLPFHPDVLKTSAPYLQITDKQNRSCQIIENSGKWRTYFSVEQIEELERIAGKYLAVMGYNIVKCAGNEQPSEWRIWSWQLRDTLQKTLRFFTYKSLASIEIFLRRARESVIQSRTNRW